MIYCECTQLVQPENETRSPILFVHGFPDSPQMWQAYWTEAERTQPWLNGRSVYAFSFPNRQTRSQPIPAVRELRGGVLDAEFAAALTEIAQNSPTGQLIPIAHDLGATYTWRAVREGRAAPLIEKLVSFSVGSSFRYDLGEHGLRAFTWLYQVLYIVPHTIRIRPLQNLLAYLLTRVAGYRGEDAANVWRDTYHYWEGWLWPLRLPFYLLGAAYERPFLDFPFPVLFLRSRMDRIASTRAFEAALQARPDCEFVLLPAANHWFPEQHPEQVLPHIRTFLA